MVTKPQLESAIRSRIDKVSTLVVSDVSGGCGQAYDVIIVSEVFEGLTTLKRHRMVNELLKDEIAQLHAFSQKTFTPKQYQDLSKDAAATNTPATAAAGSTPSGTQANSKSSSPSLGAAPPTTGGSTLGLGAPLTPTTRGKAGGGGGSHHRSTSSVSIPELTLTTDDETLGGGGGSASARANRRGGGGGSGGSAGGVGLGGSSSPGGGGGGVSQLPDMMTSTPPPVSPNISNLHFSTVKSVEFWEGLRTYLESQLLVVPPPPQPTAAASASSETVNASSSSTSTPASQPPPPPSPSGATTRRPKGEAEVAELWDAFLATQKRHLSANDIARIRDGVGLYGQGGV